MSSSIYTSNSFQFPIRLERSMNSNFSLPLRLRVIQPTAANSKRWLEDVPQELRLMTYEHLFTASPVQIHFIRTRGFKWYSQVHDPRNDYLSVIDVSKQFSAEAAPVFLRKALFTYSKQDLQDTVARMRSALPPIHNLYYNCLNQSSLIDLIKLAIRSFKSDGHMLETLSIGTCLDLQPYGSDWLRNLFRLAQKIARNMSFVLPISDAGEKIQVGYSTPWKHCTVTIDQDGQVTVEGLVRRSVDDVKDQLLRLGCIAPGTTVVLVNMFPRNSGKRTVVME